MSDIKFVGNLPPSIDVGRYATKHVVIAAALRERPGEWAMVSTQASPSAAGYIRHAKGASYAPAGSFEATARKNDKKWDIYARYVGENGEHR
jgi:Tfp pilus assembly protein FimV